MNRITIFHQAKSVIVVSDEEVEITIETSCNGKLTETVKANGFVALGRNDKSLLEDMEPEN